MLLFLHAAYHPLAFEMNAGHDGRCEDGTGEKNNDDPFEEQHRAKSI